ncbi:vinorine synthase-like [Euphorbia lathyris]|uniref:vinorine synthase-like n=1 Tax=Euphorbia lathyris TaxID=212925 RepID=UPI003313A4C9
MGIEIEFISKELIKPSSPTPHHLHKLHFSFLDQIQAQVSPPFTLFYEKSSTITNLERCNLLKKSLSMALNIFYPLAGRINNYSYADCNDEGALFIEAKANCHLSDILQNRNQYHNHRLKFIPLQPRQGIHQYGSLFQVTYFNCGGLALSFAMPHMLGDALSQFVFLNSWAAVARGNMNTNTNTLVDIPPIGSASIFPPLDSSDSDVMQLILKENFVTKSFVFDAIKLSALRDKYSGDGENLSRMQGLSVFLLSRITAAISRPKEGADKSRSVVVNAMNLRPFVDPPIPKNSFGNFVWMGVAIIDNLEHMAKEDEYCCEIGSRIRDSIKSVNKETVKKLQCDDQLNFLKETFAELRKEI